MSDGDFLSPESTVTSLLASSGHLRSNQHHPESPQTIWYKHRAYESASEALDAYIADFQRNQVTSGQSAGQLKLPKTPVTSRLPHSGFKNKDVLKESLTQRELNYLSLPIGARRRTSDRLSLSTDDLVVLPCDGSLPVTRTSAFLSQSGLQLPQHGSYSQTQLSSQLKPTVNHKSQPLPKHGYNAPRQSYCHRSSVRSKFNCTTKTALKQPHKSLLRIQTEKKVGRTEGILSGSCPLHKDASAEVSDGTAGVHHYPRWMTSQRSEMDFSGITSVPELKYPAWLQECDTPAEPRKSTQTPHSSVPSWLGQLEESYQEKKKKKQTHKSDHESLVSHAETEHRTQTTSLLHNHLSLRELRLQFAEQLAVEDENQRHDSSQPFRDDKIECLIQRAEQALNSPSLGIGHQSQSQSSPGGTDEVLEAERSWDNPPVPFKSPVPVGVSNTPQKNEESEANLREECLQTLCSSSSGYSSRKHPGPVEALKQMLFSLQAVEQKVAQDKDPVIAGATGADEQALLSQEHQVLTEEVPNTAEDFGSVPGGESLQRALHHLGRLKHLVDDIKEKKEREQPTARNHHGT